MSEQKEQILGLRTRAKELEKELNSVNSLLTKLGDDVTSPRKSAGTRALFTKLGLTTGAPLPPPGKSGHLFKWQDRSIGFGGFCSGLFVCV